MVRLVFRPYTQVRRTICTSVSLRASTRVSPGFTLLRHSSPSFGSQQICSRSFCSARWCFKKESQRFHFHYAVWVFHSNTRIYVRLLGPCFKTGEWKAFRQGSWALSIMNNELGRVNQTELCSPRNYHLPDATSEDLTLLTSIHSCVLLPSYNWMPKQTNS